MVVVDGSRDIIINLQPSIFKSTQNVGSHSLSRSVLAHHASMTEDALYKDSVAPERMRRSTREVGRIFSAGGDSLVRLM